MVRQTVHQEKRDAQDRSIPAAACGHHGDLFAGSAGIALHLGLVSIQKSRFRPLPVPMPLEFRRASAVTAAVPAEANAGHLCVDDQLSHRQLH